jgi:hypothetical protein
MFESFLEQYNTTEDVFNFLKNPNNLHYFQSKETIHIALCFKNEPQTVCVSNPEGPQSFHFHNNNIMILMSDTFHSRKVMPGNHL